MERYYTAETAPNAHITSKQWVATLARTLDGAKRVAQTRRLFEGTCAHVGIRAGDGYRLLATRYPDGALQSGWIDHEVTQ